MKLGESSFEKYSSSTKNHNNNNNRTKTTTNILPRCNTTTLVANCTTKAKPVKSIRLSEYDWNQSKFGVTSTSKILSKVLPETKDSNDNDDKECLVEKNIIARDLKAEN